MGLCWVFALPHIPNLAVKYMVDHWKRLVRFLVASCDTRVSNRDTGDIVTAISLAFLPARALLTRAARSEVI